MVADVLIGKLVAAEELYGEEGVAERCGMKVQMYRLIKSRRFGFSRKALGAIVRNFPGLAPDVLAYLSADAEPVEAAA